MANVLLYHVVGDLTVGKPELNEFTDTNTVADAVAALKDSTECGIPVWKPAPPRQETIDQRQDRFVGILTGLDIVAHLASESSVTDADTDIDTDRALSTPVSAIVIRNNYLLKHIDPAARLIDALEIMKTGVRRLLVPRVTGRGPVSKKFSVMYHGKWLKPVPGETAPESLCVLSREDIIRFLIGCLGSLAPIPLKPIVTLGAFRKDFVMVDSQSPASDAAWALGVDPPAAAVVEKDGEVIRIVGDISGSRLWKCDLVSAAWAFAKLNAGSFMSCVEDMPVNAPTCNSDMLSCYSVNAPTGEFLSKDKEVQPAEEVRGGKKFSTRTREYVKQFYDNYRCAPSGSRSGFRGRKPPLTCRPENSLAAVMAQMLSNRATHLWVTERNPDSGDERLVGIVSYNDIIHAVTLPPDLINSSISSSRL